MVNIKKVLKQLEDDDPIVRRDAILILGELKDTKTVEPLMDIIKGDTLDNRIAAIVAISEIGDHRAIELLVYCLMDEEEKIRLAAARALGKFSSPQAISTLLVSLRKDPSISVRSRAALSLGSIGSEMAVEELMAESKIEQPATLLYSINTALNMIARKNGYNDINEMIEKLQKKKIEIQEKVPEYKQEQEKQELESFPRLFDYIRKYVARELEGIQSILSIDTDEKTASKRISDILSTKFWKFVEWIGKRMGHPLTEYQSELLWQMIWDTAAPIREEIFQMIRDHQLELEELRRFQNYLEKVDEKKEEELVREIVEQSGKEKVSNVNQKTVQSENLIENKKIDKAEKEKAADLARSISNNIEDIMAKYSSWKKKELEE